MSRWSAWWTSSSGTERGTPTLRSRRSTSEPATATLYDRLGVTPAASTEELRAAYRALARRLHPDRQQEATPAERDLAERRMREINEAWEVLQDPARRRAYDQQRMASSRSRGGGPTASGQPGPAAPRLAEQAEDLVDVGPELHGVRGAVVRHLPWVVVLGVLAVIFVATAYAGSGTSTPATTTLPLAAGRCVDVAAGPVATVVSCDGPHELRIVARITEAQVCPAGSERRRLGTDGLLDCVVLGP